MSEKMKWFNPQNKNSMAALPLPTPILDTSALSAADLQEFRVFLDSCRGRPLGGVTWVVLNNLLDMPPRIRLARNLKQLIDLMVRHPIESLMQDGLTESEKDALIALEKLDARASLKLTAQALLNIYERYQLAMTLQEAFA